MPQHPGQHNVSEWVAGLSPEEREAHYARVGAAETETKRRKRMMRDVLKEMMTLDVPDEELAAKLQEFGVDSTVVNGLMYQAIRTGLQGEIEAVRFVRDTLGEKPTEAFNMNLTGKPVKALDLTSLSDAELEALADEADEGER
jgi:hypothetical protein